MKLTASRIHAGLALTVAFVLAALLVSAVGDLRYAPSNEDEGGTFVQLRLFYETGSVKSVMMIDEAASPLLEANWYGIFYPIFYGSILKWVGLRAAYYVLINAVLVLVMVGVVLGSRLEAGGKPLAVLLLLVSPAVSLYLYTFFPETLHLCFTVILSLMLVRLDRLRRAGEPLGRSTALYILLAIAFSLFRVSLVFWLVAVLAFVESRRDFVRKAAAVGGAAALIVVYMRLFTAPMWIKGGDILGSLVRLQIGTFVQQALLKLGGNLRVFFVTMDVAAFVLVLVTAVLVAEAVRQRRDTLLVAAALVAGAHFAVLFTLYETYMYAFNKHTAALFGLFAIVAAARAGTVSRTVVIAAMLLAFPQHVMRSLQTIGSHRAAFREYVARSAQVAAFSKIRSLVDPARENLVLWLYSEHGFSNRNSLIMLPVSSVGGKPIRYTTNVVWDERRPETEKFRMHGRRRIHYVLSKNPLGQPGLRLVARTPFYSFYENTAR